MRRSIRMGMFETNSSSVHAMVVCDKDTYEAWQKEEVLFNAWERKLVPVEEIEDEDFPYPEDYDPYDRVYLTEKEFWKCKGEYYETFLREFESKHGDVVVVFGYYGHD